MSDDHRCIRDVRHLGYAYAEQHCTVSWLPGDHGPEFICLALYQWAFEHGLELRLIQPDTPTQDGFIESFNDRFGDECLNEHWFSDIVHARKIINDWRQDYNQRRPHSALGWMTPPAFAEKSAGCQYTRLT